MKRVMPWWLLIVLVLYGSTSARAQTTLNLSQDLVTRGIAAANMVPNQPTLDAGPLFMAGVNYAKANGISIVVADPGAYYFLSIWNVPGANTHVAVSGIDNMTIDLHGADLIFSHPLYYGITVFSGTNWVLQNFTVDYQPLPFTQLRVIAVDVPHLQIQYSIEPGFQDPATFNATDLPPGLSTPEIQIHVFRNGRPILRRMHTQLPFTGTGLTVLNYPGDGPANTLSAVRPGDVLAVSLRGYGSAVGANCTGCALRNITVYSCGCGGAAVMLNSAQSTVLERIYSIPKPGTDRLISTTNAAAIGVSGPNNQIRLSRAIRNTDDGFWTFGRVVGTVQTQSDSRTFTVAADSAFTWKGLGGDVPNGVTAGFENPSSGAILGSAAIVSQGTPASTYPYQTNYTFDHDLPGSLVGSVMYLNDAALNGANTVIERNAVHSASAARGIDITGLYNLTIRGNYIDHQAWAGISLDQSMQPGEPPTPPLTDLTVTNNVIDGSALKSDWWWYEMGGIQSVTLSTAFDLMPGNPLSNLTITNNFIANSGRSGVWLGNTNGGSITGNYLLNPNARPDTANAYGSRPGDELRPLVVDTTSTGVTVSGNTIDTTSGRLNVTDTQFRELAAYAPGGVVRLNAYNIGALASPTLTLTDADGVVTPLTVQTTTAQALDVPLPAGAALGGAYVTLVSGGTKYFGTLFVDSQDNIPAVNGCTYETSLSSTSVAATASTLPILVVTQAGCSYPVLAPDAWATTSPSGTGTGVIAVAFATNAGGTRTTTIEIAGQPFTITQAVAAPSITTQPTSQTVAPSQPFSLSVVATGPGPLSYQWYVGASGDTSHPLPSAGSTYSATASATCCFWVRVSNAGGHVDSGTAAITVGPGATTPPASRVGTNFGGSPGGDAFLYNPSTGAWSMQLSSAGNFVGLTSGAWAANWTIQAGDFNGDGLTDLFLYNPTNGLWFKVINLGGGNFSYFGGTWAPNWNVTLLDFDGDGKTDVFLYNQTTGRWFRAMSVGDGDFAYVTGVWAPGWSIYPADFNGDGRADLFLYNHNAASDPNHGLWFRVITQADGSFTYLPGDVRWANTWTVMPADLNGDGLTDLFLYNPTNGQYFRVVFVNGVATYDGGIWGPNWTIAKGDFNGDGRADLFLYNKTTGLWFVVITNPDGTLSYFNGLWAPNWDVTVTDFDADGRSDILLYNQATGMWFQAVTVSPGTFSFTTGNWGTGWNVIAGRTILP